MSPGSGPGSDSGSPVEDESKAALAKIKMSEKSGMMASGAGGASQTSRTIQIKKQLALNNKQNKKSPSPPSGNGISDPAPKKFFRLGSKNGVIRLSPSPPPTDQIVVSNH